MKKIFTSALLMLTLLIGKAQDSSLIKPPSLGGFFFLKDFTTGAKVFGLNTKGWNGILDPGINGLYTQGINPHLDFVATLGGCFSKYKRNNSYFYDYKNGNRYSGEDKFLLEGSAMVSYKFLTDNKPVNPYVSGGFGLALYNRSYLLPYIPVGGGLQFNLGNYTYLYVQTILDWGVIYAASKENFNYSVGVSFPLKKPVAKHKLVPIVELDTDHDGIPDSKDKCPTVAGIAKYDGCPIPDTDGDGINDENDSCPLVPGLAKYHGCPIPDTDHDGINDEEDSCPTVPGVAKYHGCPIPDRDHDGVNDEEDQCPDEPGTIENKGCPEIQSKISELAKSIFFKTGSSIIAPKAYPVLDQVVTLMVKYPNFHLDVEGHTDNVGSPIANQKISQHRADAIKGYFTSKGINTTRLYAVGYGLEKPIASNKTATGRALNRRVELHAKY